MKLMLYLDPGIFGGRVLRRLLQAGMNAYHLPYLVDFVFDVAASLVYL